ncbi:MAG: efflux RND transporter periplasmic adaptor subunit [Chlorobiaceae bacterium]|nr:efflux RND transporter periplasmic adaptor subunit [Chlorobiaceae bacterium]
MPNRFFDRFSRTQRLAAVSAVVVAITLVIVFRPAAIPVDVAEVASGPLRVTLEAEGVTRVNDRFTLAAPVTGNLQRISLDEGDSVKQGAGVAFILPPDLGSREYREAEARVGSARASMQEALARQRQVAVNLGQAGLRFSRYQRLYEEGAVSKESFELARNEAEVLKKEKQAAASLLEAARYNLSAVQTFVDQTISGKPYPVIAPVNGRVLRIHEKNERLVQAGSPLLDIGDPAKFEIVLDVLSSDAVRVRPGNPVLIEEWGGDNVLPGVVKTIEPAAFTKLSALGIEEKRVNIIALLNDYEPRLGDNFRVQGSIVLREAASVLKVPVSALFRSREGWNVFVIKGDRATQRAVTIGLRGTYEAEVLKGLGTGDRVIVHPANELHEGARIKAAK